MDISSVPTQYRPARPEADVPGLSNPPPAVVKERQELIQAVKAVNQSEFFGQDNEVTFALDRD